jgi:predicted phage terminase large subunit-like protein
MANKIINISFEEEHAYLQKSPAYFAAKVYNYIIADHHFKILEHIVNFQRTLDLSARGSGKSRIATIAYPSWVICNQPNARILILSDVDSHSVRFLSTIKKVLESSPIIEKHYGKMQGPQWSDHQITTALRTNNTLSEAGITALGQYSGAVTTGHYSHILIDDLDNFSNTRTAGMRERAKSFIKTTVLPTVLPGGEIHVVGTRYRFDDIYNTFMKDLKYDTQIQPAIIDEGTTRERSIWENFMPLKTRMINGVKVKGLLDIKKDIGSLIFELQYQNRTTLQESGSIFKWEWFNFYTETPHGLQIYQAADLAISKKDSSDYFVLITIGIDNAGNVYVLDIFRKRGISFNSQLEVIIQKAEEYKPLKVGIETNGYQAALSQEVKRLTLLPVIELTTTKDKVLRAQKRSGIVESGRVYVRQDMHDFISELVLFSDTTGVDDQFDAFDFSLTVAEKQIKTRRQNGYFLPVFK